MPVLTQDPHDHIVRNLMFGFGDDRNPANDTVNVMEEILVEYIVDVVSSSLLISIRLNHVCRLNAFERPSLCPLLVSNRPRSHTQDALIHRGPSESVVPTCRRKEVSSHGGTAVHAGGYKACESPV